jgi:hypothetical protein
MSADKDTIYVDIDDEITTIIDKVRGSEGKVIALVLPKRATVFQSIVNMKLLKRAAESAKKHLVLVTTEANLMPLAGAVGLHVASSPQSKPEIPAAVTAAKDDSLDEPIDEAAFTADNAGDQPIGELAKRSGHVVGGAGEPETAKLDDEDDAEGEPAPLKKDRHLKVPSFNKFRLRLALGLLLVVVIIGGFITANALLTKATIAIITDSSTVNVAIDPTLDTKATALDTAKLVIPATSQQDKKTLSQQVDATGQKNTGDAAAGNVDMTAQACAPFLGTPDTVPAGTGLSTNGLTFITGENASFSFDHFSGGSCAIYKANNISITAQGGGAKYNVSSVDFTVAGRSDVTAHGSASGGTDNIVTVVSQDDIDGAKKKLGNQDTTQIQTQLAEALRQAGLYPLTATFKASTPKVTTDKNVGDQADKVTVSEAITYAMLGVQQSDLDALIKANIGTQIDTKSQVILDDGMGQATVTPGDSTGSQTQITVQTTATIGPDINVAKVKQQAAGKRIGDVKSMINQIPGVVSVNVQLSPFWVSTIPSDAHQVVVTIDNKGQ